MKRIIYSFLLIGLIIGVFNSCSEDFLDPTLKQEKDINKSINTVEDLSGVLRGVYNRITSTFYYGRDYILYGETMSDNCFANGNSGRFLEPAEMNLGPSVAYPDDTWEQIYRVIAAANIILNADLDAIEGDQDQINNIVGQAYAIRAMAHFDLLRLYGQQHVTGSDLGVPYITKFASDVSNFEEEDLNPPRLTVDQTKTKIYQDITKARNNLSGTTYDYAAKPYQYFNIDGANALWSRVALYFGDYDQVITASEAVIGNYSIVDSADFVSLWQADGGADAILEMAYTSTDNNGIDGLAYMYRGGSYGDVEATTAFASIFDSTDVRMMGQTQVLGQTLNMIGIGPELPALRNNGKWPDMANFADNVQLFRYEEVILNYGEALMEESQTGIIGGSTVTPLEILNMIPQNRGGSIYATASVDNFLLERRKELCFEGFRFHDLLRRGRDIPTNGQGEGNYHEEVSYGDYRLAFPIPESEIESNKNMVQNEGYTAG